MEHLVLPGGRRVPADAISVSFTRDLGADGGPDAAREIPSTVEFRVDLRRWNALSGPARERLLAHPDLQRDSKGTVLLRCGEHASRGQNLDGARAFMAQCIQEAIDDRVPEEVIDQPVDGRRRSGAGLVKSRTKRR